MSDPEPGLSTRSVHSGNDVDRRMVTRPKSLPIYESVRLRLATATLMEINDLVAVEAAITPANAQALTEALEAHPKGAQLCSFAEERAAVRLVS